MEQKPSENAIKRNLKGDTSDKSRSKHTKHPSQSTDYVYNPPENLGVPPSKKLQQFRRQGRLASSAGGSKEHTMNTRGAGSSEEKELASQNATSEIPIKIIKDNVEVSAGKGDISDDEVDYATAFKEIAGKTIRDIVALIPRGVSGSDEKDRHTTGDIQQIRSFAYQWTDLKDLKELRLKRKEWIVRVHEPSSDAPIGSHARDGWIVRIAYIEGSSMYYMDQSGKFRRWNADKPNNARIRNSTHIPIQTPDPYISPIANPEYYGRKK